VDDDGGRRETHACYGELAVPPSPESDDSDRSDTVPTTNLPERRRALGRGATVGRYVVIDRAGEGGMGVVYKAYDPELERAVALKLLHAGPRTGDDAERRQARLLREAKALARLSHPNVVAVHDAGTFEGDVFLATEFVEGAPLKSWLFADKPSQKEVLRVMIAAGEGLAAAHRAGLVHRDVKPGNLHVGKDGRARVLDFGLARADSSDDTTRDEWIASPVSDRRGGGPATTDVVPDGRGRGHAATGPISDRRGGTRDEHGPVSDRHASLDEPLTRVGHVVGTPRYMAPEQHRKSAVDARSDQFSYCATLYEVLYGEVPFDAGDDEYRTSVTEGRLRAAPANARVPRWLRQVIVRGLSAKPEDRWPSMDALLAELRKDPAAKRRRAIAVGVLVAGAGLLALGVHAASARKGPPPCTGAEAKLAGVWDDGARASMASAFRASGAPGADAAFARAARGLDDYAAKWTAMRTDACMATRVRADQSEELLDLRMECLDARLGAMRAQVQALAQGGAAAVGKAAQAVGALPSIDTCADAALLRAPIRPPANAEARAKVAATRERVAAGHAKQLLGAYGEALAIANETASDASALGYAPLEAEALYLLADVEDDEGDYKESEKTFVRAATSAMEGHDDEVLARSLAALVVEVGLRQARFEEAHAWASLAVAAADRGDAFARGEVRRNEGRLLYREGKFAEARAQTEACLALWRPALGEDAFPVAGALTDLGNASYALGDYAKATETYERSIAVLEKSVGPDSPLLGANLNNVGDAASKLGQFDRALSAAQRAVDVWTAGFGPVHPKVALARYTLGEVWRRKGDPVRALAEFRRSLDVYEKTVGPDSAETAYAVEGIADATRDAGDAKGAIPWYERALALREKALGPTHEEVADTLTGLGQAKLVTGDAKGAVALLERANHIRESTRGDPKDADVTKRALADARHAAHL
jgi:serine/threonine protein kinase